MITADISTPYDAAPSPDGKTIYFTATGSQGAGVYRAMAGGQPALVFAGSPLVFPCAIAVSGDGTRVFVSDPGAEPSDGVNGGVYEISLPRGTPTLVGGSAGFSAAGLEVASNKLYVAGTAADGVPGLYAADVGGGSLAPVATGAQFAVPSGIAIRSSNEIYVADSGNGAARIVRVSGGTATVFLANIQLGYPAGIALTPDNTALLVSALDSHATGDAVLRVNLASGHVESTSAGIDQFVDPAGLHRASQAPVYAWADTTANGSGTVLVFGN
jgi:DNA-binding beta-propeller fold protein YncE